VLDLFSLKGKVCIVTGGARGIGLEVVRGLPEAGADVGFTYLTSTTEGPEGAERVSRETGRQVKAFRADVTDRKEIANVVENIVDEFGGRLDVVVANARVCRQISSLDYDEESWAKDYSVNVDGAMWTAQAAGKIFKAQGHGNLIITASVSSILVNMPQPQTSYNSSKSAAAHIAKNLAVEWVDFARVNAVSPGYVGTNSTSCLSLLSSHISRDDKHTRSEDELTDIET
jgi:sorbose reductase